MDERKTYKLVKECEKLVEEVLEALAEFEATGKRDDFRSIGIRDGFGEWLKKYKRCRIMKGE